MSESKTIEAAKGFAQGVKAGIQGSPFGNGPSWQQAKRGAEEKVAREGRDPYSTPSHYEAKITGEASKSMGERVGRAIGNLWR